MRIFFSVGEPSGDLHGANLIRQLRAKNDDLECVGYGGPEMAEAGCKLHADLTRLAIMWFVRIFLNLHKFWDLLSRADRYFRHHRPDAVVLIDYPGFNWWIARRAKAHRIPVFYYGTPQIWAWASWRVKKMRRFVDHVLCKLPFEEAWFRERGCNATHVGHPYFDEVRRYRHDEAFVSRQRALSGPLVAILPGSRTQEVLHNLPWLLKAAALVHAEVPAARFAVAAFKPEHAEVAGHMIADSTLAADTRIEVFVKKSPELMQLAHCCMAVSGSVSLELLYHARPTVILYWITRTAYFVQNFMRKVRYITLVNLLASDDIYRRAGREDGGEDAARVLFPEYLTCEDRTADIARHVIHWLTDRPEYERRVARLAELRDRVGGDGASERGAAYILAALAERAVRPPKGRLPSKQLGATPKAA